MPSEDWLPALLCDLSRLLTHTPSRMLSAMIWCSQRVFRVSASKIMSWTNFSLERRQFEVVLQQEKTDEWTRFHFSPLHFSPPGIIVHIIIYCCVPPPWKLGHVLLLWVTAEQTIFGEEWQGESRVEDSIGVSRNLQRCGWWGRREGTSCVL